MTLGAGETSLPYFQAAKAIAHYHLGNFAEALDWGARAINHATAAAPAKAKAYAVLSIARWQLNQKVAAREMLANGDALVPPITSAQDARDLGESWLALHFARLSWMKPRPSLAPTQSGEPRLSHKQYGALLWDDHRNRGKLRASM